MTSSYYSYLTRKVNNLTSAWTCFHLILHEWRQRWHALSTFILIYIFQILKNFENVIKEKMEVRNRCYELFILFGPTASLLYFPPSLERWYLTTIAYNICDVLREKKLHRLILCNFFPFRKSICLQFFQFFFIFSYFCENLYSVFSLGCFNG